MAFGTADRRKADVAEGVSLAVGHVATRRANRLGVLAFGGSEPRIMRPRQGRLGLLALLAELRRDPEGDGAGATSLGPALGRAAAGAGAAAAAAGASPSVSVSSSPPPRRAGGGGGSPGGRGGGRATA